MIVDTREGYPDEFVEFLKHCDGVEYADAKLRLHTEYMRPAFRSSIRQDGPGPWSLELLQGTLRLGQRIYVPHFECLRLALSCVLFVHFLYPQVGLRHFPLQRPVRITRACVEKLSRVCVA